MPRKRKGIHPAKKQIIGKPAKRRCLGRCGKMFNSTGAGNRICPKCSNGHGRSMESIRVMVVRGKNIERGE